MTCKGSDLTIHFYDEPCGLAHRKNKYLGLIKRGASV